MSLLFLKKVLLKLASAMSLPCRSRERLDNSLYHTSERRPVYYAVSDNNTTPVIISRQLLITFCLPWHIRFQSSYICFSYYSDVTMGAMASQIISLPIVNPSVNSGADQRKTSKLRFACFVRGINRGPVNSPHKWPVTRKMFAFDYVIMKCILLIYIIYYCICLERVTYWDHLIMLCFAKVWTKRTHITIVWLRCTLLGIIGIR